MNVCGYGHWGVIFAVIGTTASGKNAFMRKLIECLHCQLVKADTTRLIRANDENDHKYDSLTVDQFMEAVTAALYAWHEEIFGKLYGTRITALDAGFRSPTGAVIDVVPHAIPKLINFAAQQNEKRTEYDPLCRVVPICIDVDPQVAIARACKRDGEISQERREGILNWSLQIKWLEERMGISCLHLNNNGSLGETLQQFQQEISRWLITPPSSMKELVTL